MEGQVGACHAGSTSSFLTPTLEQWEQAPFLFSGGHGGLRLLVTFILND